MNTKLIITAIIIILIIVLTAWYSYSNLSQQVQLNPNNNVQSNADTTGDTTTSISNSLNQILDGSSLNSETDSLNQSIKDF